MQHHQFPARMKEEPISPIIIEGAFGCPVGSLGITELSTTRSPFVFSTLLRSANASELKH
jgi:hypothetical protein